MALTKADIIEAVQEKAGFHEKQSVEVVENILELMKRSLEDGEDVLISGFGKFNVMEKAPRKGRNPATGDDLELPARRVVTFKCSGLLRDKVNNGTE